MVPWSPLQAHLVPCHHQPMPLHQTREAKGNTVGAAGQTTHQIEWRVRHRTTAVRSPVVTETADAESAQDAIDPAHPTEANAAQMSEAAATPQRVRKEKNAATTVSAAVVAKSAAASETAAVDANVTANPDANLENLAIAADASAALATTDDATSVGAVAAVVVVRMIASGDAIRRIRGRDMEM